jgi:hypothetical protein
MTNANNEIEINMEDRLPEPIALQTRQNSIGKFLCTMRL